jgi:hypothetical protein
MDDAASCGSVPPRGTSGDYSITRFALSQYAGSVKKIFAIHALSPSCSDLESSCKNCQSLRGRLCLFRNIQESPFCHISLDRPPAEVPEREFRPYPPIAAGRGRLRGFPPGTPLMMRLRALPRGQAAAGTGNLRGTGPLGPAFLASNLLTECFDKPCRVTGKKCRKGLDNPAAEVLRSKPQVARPDRTEERGWRGGTGGRNRQANKAKRQKRSFHHARRGPEDKPNAIWRKKQ